MLRGNISKLLSLLVIILGLFVFGIGLLPESVLSNWIISFSYSRKEINELRYLVILGRCIFISMGTCIAAHALPSVRTLWADKILPSPPLEFIDAYQPGISDQKTWFLMIACLSLMSSPIFVALWLQPRWLRFFLQEDRGYEAATAYAYLAAGLLMALGLVKSNRRAGGFSASRLLLIGLCVLFVLVGLEEMSYGQRIFHFHTPGALAEINQQGEFNLHNIATGLINRLFAACIISGGVMVPLAGWLSPRIEYLSKRLGIMYPQSASVLAFAYASTFTTPRRFVRSAFDEQRFLYFVVVLAFLGLLLYSVFRKKQWKALGPMMGFVMLMIASRMILAKSEHLFAVPNYPEEFKEWLFGFGFLLYSWNFLTQLLFI